MTPDRLETLLAGFAGTKILVVGDLMLDEYVWGDVARISPDAPVQVVEIKRRSRAIGGAGNVAHNIASAGGEAALVGVVGEDQTGLALPALLMGAGVEAGGIVIEPGRPTTVKTRIVARGQHVLRLDEETGAPLQPATRARLLDRVAAALPGCAAVLVSDYAKGVVDDRLVADLVRAAAGAQMGAGRGPVPILVDPKHRDLSRYAGCFALTPNQREAELATGVTIRTEADLEEAARRIQVACGDCWVLITRGDRGMALVSPDGRLDIIPARTREVYDVTGAGDIVMAYFGLALATGAAPLDAAWLANIAAGIGVGKVGTAEVRSSEILALELEGRNASRKVVTLKEAVARLEHGRSLGRRIVFTNGCFDLLHAGHIHLLERARGMGDLLVVAINSDASVHRLKGEGRPILAQEDRATILSALDAVDVVVIFGEDTPLEAIHQVRPDVLVKGGDYIEDTIVGAGFVRSYGGTVATIPLVEGRSTSSLIAAIDSRSTEAPRPARGKRVKTGSGGSI